MRLKTRLRQAEKKRKKNCRENTPPPSEKPVMYIEIRAAKENWKITSQSKKG